MTKRTPQYEQCAHLWTQHKTHWEIKAKLDRHCDWLVVSGQRNPLDLICSEQLRAKFRSAFRYLTERRSRKVILRVYPVASDAPASASRFWVYRTEHIQLGGALYLCYWWARTRRRVEKCPVSMSLWGAFKVVGELCEIGSEPQRIAIEFVKANGHPLS